MGQNRFGHMRVVGNAQLVGDVTQRGNIGNDMHYDLAYFDLEEKTLQPLDSPTLAT